MMTACGEGQAAAGDGDGWMAKRAEGASMRRLRGTVARQSRGHGLEIERGGGRRRRGQRRRRGGDGTVITDEAASVLQLRLRGGVRHELGCRGQARLDSF